MEAKRRGRKPVERAPDDQIVHINVTLRASDVKYLLTLNPKNVSAAVRDVIDEVRGTN